MFAKKYKEKLERKMFNFKLNAEFLIYHFSSKVFLDLNSQIKKEKPS